MNQRSTIRDVALAAKVSPSTVSRYFNGTGYVSIQTRRRIENAVARTGYELSLIHILYPCPEDVAVRQAQ